MKDKALTIKVSDSIGSVSAILTRPKEAKALVTLAHGAGAGMHHHFMQALAQALADRSVGTLRFNFPFTEQGKKRPDVPAVAEKTVKSVLHYATETFQDIPVYASGKSFGGRMTSQLLSKECPPFVKGIIFYGFPLHAPGKPSVTRAAHLSAITIPMLFLQGTKDALADITLIDQVCSSLPTAQLKVFEGADHSFKKGKEILIEALADATATWIAR